MSSSKSQIPDDIVDLSDLRVPYHDEDQVSIDFSMKDPFKIFDEWFRLAHSTEAIKEANAMALATADKSGKPSSRYVLLKGYGKDGFRFFTNYKSRKGKEIDENPQVSLLFYWESLIRQIRIEGTASKLSESESTEYFHLRPRTTQISASISHQSEVIESREVLRKKREEFECQYADAQIPKPDHWGGYNVTPNVIEFWCGRTDRLHDRLRFRKPLPGEIPNEKTSFCGADGWIYEYLSP